MIKSVAIYKITFFDESQSKIRCFYVEASNGEQAQNKFLLNHDPLMYRILNCYMSDIK